MKKRMLALLLILSLVLSPVPTVRAEAAADPEAIIARQYDAFIQTLKPGGTSEGPMELVLHSIGGGGLLLLDQGDSMTRTILHSNLMREAFVQAATALCRSAGGVFGGGAAHLSGNLYCYENQMGYSLGAHEDNGNADISDDPFRSPGFHVENLSYRDRVNGYDEAMFLVVGDARCRFSFRPQSITDSTVRYRVTITVEDKFDFNNDEYYGDDQDLEKFLTWVGRFLTLGLLNTFQWYATVEFDLEIPNLCAHTTHNYNWEYDGDQDLVSVSGEGFTENPLQKQDGYVDANGQFQDTWYSAEMPIHLRHDLPWTLEFRCAGNGDMVLSDIHVNRSGTFLRRNRNTLCYNILSRNEENKAILLMYGRNYSETTGFLYQDMHTFTLTNRVSEDGTNAVYLAVNGVELGAMDRYYRNGVYVEDRPDWCSGRDFVYGFIGAFHYPLRNVEVEYIRAWENGREGQTLSLLTAEPVSPDCTRDGGIRNTCSRCGAEFLTEVIPASGHDFGDWETVKDPTCAAEGRMERRCRSCDTVDRRAIDALPHSYTPSLVAPGCTEPGYTLYSCACGASYQAEPTDALGHALTDWETEGEITCTQPVTQVRRCQRCDHRESRIQDPPDHRYEQTVTAPGCTEGGYTLHTCAVCQDSYKTDFTNATGHRYEQTVTAPGCTEGGYTLHTCAVCRDSYKTNFTSPTGHRYEQTVTAPGCTEGGYTLHTCAVCQDSYKTDFTSPAGHRHEPVVTAPTCTDRGYTTYTCPCGDAYVRDYVSALGHGYEDGVCVRCGHLAMDFTDVPQGSFYDAAVRWAVEEGITSGTSATTFSPENDCLRAQVVTFLWRAAGSPPATGENPFVDVQESDFYCQAVLWAVEQGITTGTDATHFSPLGICNRAQVVTFLHRAFGSPAAQTGEVSFADVPDGGWYTAPVLWAVEQGITNGLSADLFGPGVSCNRAQIVTFLYRAYN